MNEKQGIVGLIAYPLPPPQTNDLNGEMTGHTERLSPPLCVEGSVDGGDFSALLSVWKSNSVS